MKVGNLISIFFALTALLLTGLLLTGCATNVASDNYYHDKRSQHLAEEKLANAAESISKSLAELAEIERTTHPQKKMPSPVDPNMIGMGEMVSINWSGPIEPLIKKIAETSKYKFKKLGTALGVPILVSIAAKNTQLADVLRDANFQCGNKAKIVVYPASRLIELRYVK